MTKADHTGVLIPHGPPEGLHVAVLIHHVYPDAPAVGPPQAILPWVDRHIHAHLAGLALLKGRGCSPSVETGTVGNLGLCEVARLDGLHKATGKHLLSGNSRGNVLVVLVC